MIRQWLLTYKKKTVTLEHLQQQCSSLSYDSFQSDVQALEAAGILVPVKASGRDFGGLARKYFVHKGGLKKDKERHCKRYAELVTFEQDLSLVRPSLEKKLSDISKDLTACQDKQAENRRHQEALEATMHILERENGTLQFTTDAITAAIVPIDWQTDDSAVFAKAAPPLLTDSKAAYDKVQVQRRENEKKRDEFIKYCESHILEERRRRHIVDGIRSKDSYEEYVQWKNVITKTIQTSINLAETERKEHFAHIEHIVEHMALFLGCLNYLSEKRARIGHTKYHNRVVVADNPLGKASSDHVLDPVFFIAEQLGFQMIALTAHEDGNFIRKYFPVVYSCHFADISGGKGKVLLPEKEIKTAFFEEHHPEALKRLEDYEETGLFD